MNYALLDALLDLWVVCLGLLGAIFQIKLNCSCGDRSLVSRQVVCVGDMVEYKIGMNPRNTQPWAVEIRLLSEASTQGTDPVQQSDNVTIVNSSMGSTEGKLRRETIFSKEEDRETEVNVTVWGACVCICNFFETSMTGVVTRHDMSHQFKSVTNAKDLVGTIEKYCQKYL